MDNLDLLESQGRGSVELLMIKTTTRCVYLSNPSGQICYYCGFIFRVSKDLQAVQEMPELLVLLDLQDWL